MNHFVLIHYEPPPRNSRRLPAGMPFARGGRMVQPILITGPGVWMESEATRQLAAIAQVEGCVHAVGMPDLHPGRGFPIGAVVATREVVHPHLVGGDAGCGARVVVTNVEKASPDRLERRLRTAFEANLFEAV